MDTDSDSEKLHKTIDGIVNNLDSADDTADDDDEDPVVDEIPVYLSNNLDCYLLQYPVRPATMPYDSTVMKKLKFRPKNQQIEMHMELNTNNENYDVSRGEQIALNVDGDKGNLTTSHTYASGKMDTQVLFGGKAVKDTKRYTVGIINNNELHLTQVTGVLTVRPNLSYLDKSDKRAKSEGRITDPDDPGTENETKPEAVTVKFSKGENDRIAKWKEKSYETMIKKEEEESWVNMKFNQLRSTKWDDESQNLFCENMDKEISFDLPSEKYLESLK